MPTNATRSYDPYPPDIGALCTEAMLNSPWYTQCAFRRSEVHVMLCDTSMLWVPEIDCRSPLTIGLMAQALQLMCTEVTLALSPEEGAPRVHMTVRTHDEPIATVAVVDPYVKHPMHLTCYALAMARKLRQANERNWRLKRQRDDIDIITHTYKNDLHTTVRVLANSSSLDADVIAAFRRNSAESIKQVWSMISPPAEDIDLQELIKPIRRMRDTMPTAEELQEAAEAAREVTHERELIRWENAR